MIVQKVALDGVMVLAPVVFEDNRGLFFELYKKSTFERLGLPTIWPQDNISVSKRGVLRGLHFQTGDCATAKLVRCVKGALYDVVVDIRKNSATFGQYFGCELNDSNGLAMYIPIGFAHGFQALYDETTILYKCTHVFSKDHDAGINPLDSQLKIDWPLPVAEMSDKDKNLPTLQNCLSNESLPNLT